MKSLIVQNSEGEEPGLIAEALNKRNCEFEIANLDENDFPDISRYDLFFVLGGPDSANDKTPKMIVEIERIKEIIRLQMPYFGICLGMQALAKAAGGKVCRNPVPEIGCKDYSGESYEIVLSEEGIKDPIFAGIESGFKIFQLHGETVELGSAIKLLGAGKHCKNQAIKAGNSAYGIQGHLEITEAMLKNWLAEDPMFDNFDKNKILKDFRGNKEEYRTNGLKLINNFLDIAERQKEKKLLKLAV